MVYWDERGVVEQSDAVIAIALRLGGVWSLLGAARLVPRGLRDALYRAVARRRYRWFGAEDACDAVGRDPTDRELP